MKITIAKTSTAVLLQIFILIIATLFVASQIGRARTEFDAYTGNLLQTQNFQHFSVIALPDTQHYSRDYPQIFTNQTQWITDKASDLNVAFVSHMGDIVMNADSILQWENAAESMKILDEKGLSWEVLPGNHDFESLNGLVNYNAYFGISNFSGKSSFGGAYPGGTNNNNFALFSGGDDDYLIFSFQYHPNDSVLAWANETIAQYPDRRVIVATHDYLNLDGERTFEGNHIWNSFAAPHANQVFLVLCGHMHGEARRTDDVNGYKIHQVVADYQDRPNGGNGWLRILEFHPTEAKIIVKTYSPYLNSYESDLDSQFSLELKDLSLTPPPFQSPEPTPTPTPTPRLSPGPIPTPSFSGTPEPTATPPPSPSPSPTPSASPKPSLGLEPSPLEAPAMLIVLGVVFAVAAIGLLMYTLKKKKQKTNSKKREKTTKDTKRAKQPHPRYF